MVSMMAGVGILLGAAGVTFLAATTFEDKAQKVYTGSRILRASFMAVMVVMTALVFATSGSPVLMMMAVILVVFVTLYLIFDYYSPFSRHERR